MAKRLPSFRCFLPNLSGKAFAEFSVFFAKFEERRLAKRLPIFRCFYGQQNQRKRCVNKRSLMPRRSLLLDPKNYKMENDQAERQRDSNPAPKSSQTDVLPLC